MRTESRPVSSAARLGEHRLAPEIQFRMVIPSRPIESMLGVETAGAPNAPMSPAR